MLDNTLNNTTTLTSQVNQWTPQTEEETTMSRNHKEEALHMATNQVGPTIR